MSEQMHQRDGGRGEQQCAGNSSLPQLATRTEMFIDSMLQNIQPPDTVIFGKQEAPPPPSPHARQPSGKHGCSNLSATS